jgi:D-glycero-beta-D-manno-heptose 1-phosphate adenylyltransferase
MQQKTFPEVSPDFLRLTHFWRFKNKRIVFTNGCFDILHAGHVDYLTQAAAMGDVLIIGLNTDASVSRLKGPDRPLNNQDARASVLSALSVVHAVVLFDEETPEKLIEAIRPNVLVKGSDYKVDEIVGASFVTSTGGEVRTIPFLEGYSSSSILEKLRKS